MAESQNTYQLEPREDEKFYPSKVHAIIEQTLTEFCSSLTYDQTTATHTSQEISKAVRERIKEQLKMPRYKLGIQVMLGQNKGQGLRIASKSLWDKNFDNYSSHTFTNEKLFCCCLIFGAYCE